MSTQANQSQVINFKPASKSGAQPPPFSGSGPSRSNSEAPRPSSEAPQDVGAVANDHAKKSEPAPLDVGAVANDHAKKAEAALHVSRFLGVMIYFVGNAPDQCAADQAGRFVGELKSAISGVAQGTRSQEYWGAAVPAAKIDARIEIQPDFEVVTIPTPSNVTTEPVDDDQAITLIDENCTIETLPERIASYTAMYKPVLESTTTLFEKGYIRRVRVVMTLVLVVRT